ncbi:hypothetical protein Aperf_G00000040417 [Anoplocephala perfoliata]
MNDAKPRLRSEEKALTARRQRTSKLAQYLRILPCPYSQQIFCYAAALLRWFRAEQQRVDMLAQLLETQKRGHAKGKRDTDDGKFADDENEEEGEEEEGRDEKEEDKEQKDVDDEAVQSKVAVISEVHKRIDKQNINSTAHDVEEENEEGKEEEEEGEEEKEEEEGKTGQKALPLEALTHSMMKPCVLRIPFANNTEKRLAYSLAFSSMKYYTILDKIIDEVGFYGEYPDMREEEYLVLVTLYDYTARNFQRRTSTSEDTDVPPRDERDTKSPKFLGRTFIYPPTSKIFQEVEAAVIAMCVHFAAAVARTRVKQQVGSLRLLLPEEWREAETKAEKMPFYGWYNQLLGKSEIVLTWLRENNFTRIKGRMPAEKEFADDEDCPDVFVFNITDRATVVESPIVRDRFLVIQDRSNLFALHCLLSFIGPGEEVMLVNHPNSFNGIHLEGLLMNKFPTVTPVPTIRLVRQPKENEDVKLIPRCGCKSTRIITDDFLFLNPYAEAYKGVRHIVIDSTDMKTGIVNPIDYIDFENEDLAIFRDMWTPNDNPQKMEKRLELLSKNEAYLKHALKFNQARTVLFLSHSEDPEETEGMVQKCMEFTNRALQREAQSAVPTSKQKPTTTPAFVPRLPTGIPSIALPDDTLVGVTVSSPFITTSGFIRFKPTNNYNGFFIACLKKEVTCLLYFDFKETLLSSLKRVFIYADWKIE